MIRALWILLAFIVPADCPQVPDSFQVFTGSGTYNGWGYVVRAVESPDEPILLRDFASIQNNWIEGMALDQVRIRKADEVCEGIPCSGGWGPIVGFGVSTWDGQEGTVTIPKKFHDGRQRVEFYVDDSLVCVDKRSTCQ